jgi:hypothetical protein
MERFRNSEQFKAFIKKEAKRLNISIPNAYSTFLSRSFLEKLSKKDTDKSILVKGSSAETSYLGELVRGITDVDLASTTSIELNIPVLRKIINSETINDIKFSLNKRPSITKTGIYKFSYDADMDKVKNSLNVDFQDNYIRLIEKKYSVMPKIFDGDREFIMATPSFEEYIAEKLCIILESNKPDLLNTRLKDFYDIYELHGGKYDSEKLAEYFKIMLALRAKIRLQDATTDYLDKNFIENHNDIWNAVSKKYDFLDKEIDLGGAVYYTRAVLREYLQKNGITTDNKTEKEKHYNK